jgi:uncharacterized membrane protein
MDRMTLAGLAAAMRRPVYVVTLAAGLACPLPVMAQPMAQSPPAPTVTEPASPSVGHAMSKGITFKIGTALMWLVIGYAGTGSPVDAGVLAIGTTISSYIIYVANDYAWDHLAPVPASGDSFNAASSAWRTTWKYLTFKPAINIVTWTGVYLYTGSAAQMLAMGTAAVLVVPVVFYANDMTWDWYDWYTGSPQRSSARKQ